MARSREPIELCCLRRADLHHARGRGGRALEEAGQHLRAVRVRFRVRVRVSVRLRARVGVRVEVRVWVKVRVRAAHL